MVESFGEPVAGSSISYYDTHGTRHNALVVWVWPILDKKPMVNLVYILPFQDEIHLSQDSYGMERMLETSIDHVDNLSGDKVQNCWTW